MALILGIDAAWTEAGSSGVALLETRNGRRTVLAANSSYAEFLGDDAGDRQLAGMPPDATLLLQKAENIAGAAVDLVAIDMPMARYKNYWPPRCRQCDFSCVQCAMGINTFA